MRRGAGEPDRVCLHSSLSVAWRESLKHMKKWEDIVYAEGLYSDQLPIQPMVGMAAAHLRRALHSQPRCAGQGVPCNDMMQSSH